MRLAELQYLECALCDHVDDVFEKMPDNGTIDWDLRKVDLINRIMSELSNITIEAEDEDSFE
ncbi:hypothetical protein ABY59_0200009 [Enterobacter phage phiEap-2]|uniref:hypothetical protein n=1 Tax=Enterobacter phage phiEap-2 TaxID=1701257 RepID=UPI0006BCA8D4|nr:hypothetical protein ABY59_0200009 [Enterobacter phage phiEap-2]ALA45576.1 hypothetical protein ABY59_0200009 [Enterobacter phage phiEap-2]